MAAESSCRESMLRYKDLSDISLAPESGALVEIVRYTPAKKGSMTSEGVVLPAFRFDHFARFFRRMFRHCFADLMTS